MPYENTQAMKDQRPPCIGQVLVGPLFNEPMRVETVQASAVSRS